MILTQNAPRPNLAVHLQPGIQSRRHLSSVDEKPTMKYRELGRTGWKVSAISFGAWAIGGAWGDVDDRESRAAWHRALDLGGHCLHTAHVHGTGASKRYL